MILEGLLDTAPVTGRFLVGESGFAALTRYIAESLLSEEICGLRAAPEGFPVVPGLPPVLR